LRSREGRGVRGRREGRGRRREEMETHEFIR